MNACKAEAFHDAASLPCRISGWRISGSPLFAPLDYDSSVGQVSVDLKSVPEGSTTRAQTWTSARRFESQALTAGIEMGMLLPDLDRSRQSFVDSTSL